ncbi:chloramphenicol acetyltransferase [Thalassobius sp. Cn5-15]|uniref:chloramphenicol acetyltransferase n=1 Tax=Thalassobius sp. Cn5-15 TaxID=2917763 RepID=UPI001EF1787D|nr:chloramphenicol acetyltransferase [Thalassobius sp. Cn5-15]MCG7494044.1 chloramphenicol acetyltransferase [Thalassobius sp. Cn5-15]
MPRLSADTPFLHPDAEVRGSTFGSYCEVGRGSRIQNSSFGDYSYCDRYADVANADVGKFANIASYVRLGATDHPMHTASMHHFLYRSDDYWDGAGVDEAFFAHRASRCITIGHDVWIGHNAQVKPEITIGHGAIIASGAIVTKDVAPYTIVAGVSAQPLRRRFTEDVADRMIALAWWDWDHDRLRAALPHFRAMPAEAFLEKYEGA